VLLPTGWSGPATVWFEGGTITEVRRVANVGPANPRWLVPGFVDLQVNGVGPDDLWTVAKAQDDGAWRRISSALAAQGTTSWCPTLVTAPRPDYAPVLRWLGERPHEGPRVLGVHLEGPFLGGAPGAHDTSSIVPFDPAFPGWSSSFVRMLTVAPECPGVIDAIPEIVERGIVVSLGHTTADVETCRAAVESGATTVTHLFNAMRGLTHRSPGLAALALDDPRLRVGLIADGIHVDPLILRLAFRLAEGRAFLVTDAVATTRDGGPRIGADGAPRREDGTLAGASLRMIEAVRRCVEDVGLPLESAVRAASTVPAEVVGARDRGMIEPGRLADFVALDGHLSVVGTWIGGERFREHEWSP
jgi:N-acetylglucosamine-6-phosphate deacetylase